MDRDAARTNCTCGWSAAAGWSAYLLLQHTPAGVDALGPENVLIFAPGILQGSNLPSSGRHGVGAKSPLTGAIASSEAGGWWGHEFKRTGYDALVIHGRSSSLCTSSIQGRRDSACAAPSTCGARTRPTSRPRSARELGDDKVRVAQIGVAGENGVLFSAIMHDVNRAAGRNGLGAVMGSKNLKAVAVRGTQNVPQGDRPRLRPVAKWIGQDYKAEHGLGDHDGHARQRLSPREDRATCPSATSRSRVSRMRRASTASSWPRRSAPAATPARRARSTASRSSSTRARRSPISRCSRRRWPGKTTIERRLRRPGVRDARRVRQRLRRDDLIAVAKANELCARWGLDTISTGMTIAYVMELVDRGLLTAEQTGGFLPSWGDAEAMLEAVDMIAHCRGFGEKMAQGSKRFSQWVGQGSDEFLVEVKGLEFAHARAADEGWAGPGLRSRARGRGPHDEHPRRRVLEPGRQPGPRPRSCTRPSRCR